MLQQIILIAIWRIVSVKLAIFITENFQSDFQGQDEDVCYKILSQLEQKLESEEQSFLEGHAIYIIKIIQQEYKEYDLLKKYLQQNLDDSKSINLIPWVKKIGLIQRQENISVEQAPWKGSNEINFKE